MALKTLLLSADPEVVSVIRRVMQDLGVGLSLSSTVNEAGDLLARCKFDAFIADCENLPGVDALLQRLRQGASNRSTIVFALIDANSSLRRAFGVGANFVVDKPVTAERTARSFRAALGLIMRERCRYFRLDIQLPVTVDLGDGGPQKLTTTNLSEGGMAVRTPHKLPTGAKGQVRFTLPNGRPVECRAEVAWSTEDGRAGLRLLLLTDAMRRDLAAFITGAVNSQTPMLSPDGVTRAWGKPGV